MFTDYFITLVICIICQFPALIPLVTSLALLHCDVLEPQPGVTTVKADLFLALGVQDRFPADLSATLHRLGFIYGSACLEVRLSVCLLFLSLYGAPLRWLPVRPPSLDVRECNLVELTSESGMSQALVIPDRYPAVPSVSR